MICEFFVLRRYRRGARASGNLPLASGNPLAVFSPNQNEFDQSGMVQKMNVDPSGSVVNDATAILGLTSFSVDRGK